MGSRKVKCRVESTLREKKLTRSERIYVGYLEYFNVRERENIASF